MLSPVTAALHLQLPFLGVVTENLYQYFRGDHLITLSPGVQLAWCAEEEAEKRTSQKYRTVVTVSASPVLPACIMTTVKMTAAIVKMMITKALVSISVLVASKVLSQHLLAHALCKQYWCMHYCG